MKDVEELFDDALSRVLKYEGGYVNDPTDKGGETNYGITKAVAVSAGYTGAMRDIPMSIVRAIYKVNYWTPSQAANVSLRHPELGAYIFDASVNVGVGRVSKWVQSGLSLITGKEIMRDGVLGPNSQRLLKALSVEDLQDLLNYLRASRARHYFDLVDAEPLQKRFLKGWLRRI